MAYFLNSDFCEFLSITPFKTIPIKNVGGVLKNSGNFQQERHKNFQIYEEMSEIKGPKVCNP